MLTGTALAAQLGTVVAAASDRDGFVPPTQLRGSVGVRVGKDVRAGEPIARCGNSGNSTEPHLHLQREAPAGRLGRRWPHQRRPESTVGRPGAGHLDR